MEELPYKLRVEFAMEIHKKIYRTVSFFQNKEKNFIVWIVTLLRPSFVQEQEFLYTEGEQITESKKLLIKVLVYFCIHGSLGYVLTRFRNMIYIRVDDGDHFGHTDMIQEKNSMKRRDIMAKGKILSGKDLIRLNSIQALMNSDLLIIAMTDLEKMKIEFLDIFADLFTTAYYR